MVGAASPRQPTSCKAGARAPDCIRSQSYVATDCCGLDTFTVNLKVGVAAEEQVIPPTVHALKFQLLSEICAMRITPDCVFRGVVASDALDVLRVYAFFV